MNIKDTMENPFKKNKYEIKYHLVNSGLAAGLVFIGACADGDITMRGVMLAFLAGVAIFINKFGEYWKTQRDEYKCSYLNFL